MHPRRNPQQVAALRMSAGVLVLAVLAAGAAAPAAASPRSTTVATPPPAQLRPNPGVAAPGRPRVLRAAPDPSGTPHLQRPPVTGPGSAGLQAVQPDTADITVGYSAGFDPGARRAFQAAVDVWRKQVVSQVPIHIQATWAPLGAGILGQAGPVAFRRDFSGAPTAHTYYPDALANTLAGTDLDPRRPEIEATFNSSFPAWYKGTDGRPGSFSYDFESVVLHELGHGFGFVGSADGLTPGSWRDDGRGFYGLYSAADDPTVFDRRVVDGPGRAALDTTAYPQGSTALGALIRGVRGGLWWSGPAGVAAGGGTRPRLYSPSWFEEGSSYSHLDEATYPAGSANALMTPYLANNESEHDVGPVVRGMLTDVGWPAGWPVTSTAISDHHLALGGDGGLLGPARSIEFLTADLRGRYVAYQVGTIYWSSATGAREVHGGILADWLANGGATGILGYPTSDESPTGDGVGRANTFTGGSVYWTPLTAAHEVHGGIGAHYRALSGVAGVLRYPTTDERGTPDGVGRYNHFERGSIYWTRALGAHEVHGGIRSAWAALGWERGFLGFPVSDEYAVPGGRRSDFQGGSLVWRADTRQVGVLRR